MNEAILVVLMYFGGGTLSTERVSSVEECKEIVAQLRKQSDFPVHAYCLPVKPLEDAQHEAK